MFGCVFVIKKIINIKAYNFSFLNYNIYYLKRNRSEFWAFIPLKLNTREDTFWTRMKYILNPEEIILNPEKIHREPQRRRNIQTPEDICLEPIGDTC